MQLRRTQIQTLSQEKVSHLSVFCYCFFLNVKVFLASGFEFVYTVLLHFTLEITFSNL